ncbi:hypothetical protein METP2_03770 [Methanosarcinales archaeon]|nr:hypothetical protein METP2_03770 [Methanosarcinales archaeon]
MSRFHKRNTLLQSSFFSRTIYGIPIRLAAIVLFLMGSRWFYVFAFTNYRPHLKIFMIPLGVLTLITTVCLFLYYNFSIFMLLFLSFFIFLFSLILHFSGYLQYQTSLPFFWILSSVSLVYFLISLKVLRNDFKKAN